jgi:copper(I)-binding protein
MKTDIPGAKASLHVMKGERMVNAGSAKVPALGILKFKTGGSHIMIEEMPKGMKAGSKFNLTLVFQKSGEKQVPRLRSGHLRKCR